MHPLAFILALVPQRVQIHAWTHPLIRASLGISACWHVGVPHFSKQVQMPSSKQPLCFPSHTYVVTSGSVTAYKLPGISTFISRVLLTFLLQRVCSYFSFQHLHMLLKSCTGSSPAHTQQYPLAQASLFCLTAHKLVTEDTSDGRSCGAGLL